MLWTAEHPANDITVEVTVDSPCEWCWRCKECYTRYLSETHLAQSESLLDQRMGWNTVRASCIQTALFLGQELWLFLRFPSSGEVPQSTDEHSLNRQLMDDLPFPMRAFFPVLGCVIYIDLLFLLPTMNAYHTTQKVKLAGIGSLLPPGSFWDWTQIVRIGGKQLYLLPHPTGPSGLLTCKL